MNELTNISRERFDAQIRYTVALQKAIEFHVRGEIVPDYIAKECQHHADKLNKDLTCKANVV